MSQDYKADDNEAEDADEDVSEDGEWGRRLIKVATNTILLPLCNNIIMDYTTFMEIYCRSPVFLYVKRFAT